MMGGEAGSGSQNTKFHVERVTVIEMSFQTGFLLASEEFAAVSFCTQKPPTYLCAKNCKCTVSFVYILTNFAHSNGCG